jgi:hypothetical protein
MVFTCGAAGAAGDPTGGNGGNGTDSTLVSGTQVITPLTAGGSPGSLGSNTDFVVTPATSGGTATNGDINTTGQAGILAGNIPGSLKYSVGAAGLLATTGTQAGKPGKPGAMIISWYP